MPDVSSSMNLRNVLFGAAFFTASAAAAEQIPFRDMPLEYRVCPDVTQKVDLEEGKVIKKSSSQFCYAEPHANSVMLFPRTNVQVFYEEEGKQKKDAWSGPNGYTKNARQLLITYDLNSANNETPVNYEIWFITSPEADGRGLYDRVGNELLFLTETKKEKKMKNDFRWYHGMAYVGVESKEENVWKDNGILMEVEGLMNHLRGKVSRAANKLKQYRITFEQNPFRPEREKDQNPQILNDEEVWNIAERTERIYEHAKYKEQERKK